jgi:hypothetical protein
VGSRGSAASIGALSVVAMLLLPPAGASAAPKRISGKLDTPGFTLLALAKSGASESDRARRGRFRLTPPAKRVTLQLRAPDGTYAGPVVVAREGKRRVITGVKAPAKLGRIEVKTDKGFAKAAHQLPKEVIDEKRFARAKRGVPIGAGTFGRMLSSAARPVPGDRDRDGVPDALDIDDDGDLILDNVDRSASTTRQRSRGVTPPANQVFVRSVLAAPIWDTANANAATLTDQDIDAVLRTWGRQIFNIMPGDFAELDCGGEPDPDNPSGWSGGLTYCVRGGTGAIVAQGGLPPQWPAFPECCDDDGDGLGTLVTGPPSPSPAFNLAHQATAAQIGTGDILIQRVTTGGAESEFTIMLPFVFATTPALVSYDDGQGNAATVSYPIADPNPGPNQGTGGPGTDDDPFPVKAGSGGEVVVTLIFFRPQRRPIPPEPGEWTDIGGLTYAASPATQQPTGCPQGAFSEVDPNLTPAQPPVPYAPGAGGLLDLAADQPANAANTFTYTLNLSQCLAAGGASWSTGEMASFNFGAVDTEAGNVSVAETVPGVTFELQP